MTSLIGQTIERYNITALLGEGGMATVYRALDTRLEREVAFKIIRMEAFSPQIVDRMLKRFEREAKALARLSHPNIVRIHDFGEHNGAPFLVMEYMPGGTLKKHMGQPVPPPQAAKLLIPIAQALQHAHEEGLVHRDVKPSNILLSRKGEPMLSDFGIAKILKDDDITTLTGTGMSVGTPEYMAPEQARGLTTDGRTDGYALGVVFYELLTGKRPFEDDTPMGLIIKQATEPPPDPRQFVPDLPQNALTLLERSLTKEPDGRYPDMEAMTKALQHIANPADQPTPPKETQPTPQVTQTQADLDTNILPKEPAVTPHTQEETSTLSDTTRSKTSQPDNKSTSTLAQPPQPTTIKPWWQQWYTWVGAAGLLIILLALGGLFSPKPAIPQPTEEAVPTYEPTTKASPTEIRPTTAPEPTVVSVGTTQNPIKIVFMPMVETNILIAGGEVMAHALYETTNLQFEIVTPKSNALAVEEMCASPDVTIGFISSLSYALASQLCSVDVAFKVYRYGEPHYWAEFLVQRDSTYQTLEDLDGATWGYTATNSTSGYMVPLAVFAELGIHPAQMIETGGHPQAVRAVYNGEVDFATAYYSRPIDENGTPLWSMEDGGSGDVPDELLDQCALNEDDRLWCDYWRPLDARVAVGTESPQVVQNVRILAISPPIPNDTISFGPDFPPDTRAKLVDAITAFAESDAWNESIGSNDHYGWQGIAPATDEEYDIVRNMVETAGLTLANLW